MAAHTLKETVEGNVSEVGGEVFAISKQAFLLLRNAIKTAVVVNHHDDGQLLLERCLDRQAAGQKCPIAADEHHSRLGMRVLGGQGQRNTHPQQAEMGAHDWLVFDGGNTHFWSEIAVNLAGWHGQQLAGILHPGSFSLLGVGVSLALAAKNTHPESTVVLISGDGAFLSGGLSIEAAFQEELPIVVVIDNNGGLDCISQQQERLFANGKHFATDFRDIPFHSLFQGMGGHGELVERREDLGPAIRRAIASGKTACVNVKAKGVISPIVLATTSKRDKASIE